MFLEICLCQRFVYVSVLFMSAFCLFLGFFSCRDLFLAEDTEEQRVFDGEAGCGMAADWICELMDCSL